MKKCIYCDEELLPGEEPPPDIASLQMHRECAFRAVLGSAAHIRKECICFRKDGTAMSEPDDISLREGARLAMQAFREQQQLDAEAEAKTRCLGVIH